MSPELRKNTCLLKNWILNGEVLASLLMLSSDDAEVKKDATTSLLSHNDLVRTLNILVAIALEKIELDSDAVSSAKSYVISHSPFLEEYGDLNLMALAMIA